MRVSYSPANEYLYSVSMDCLVKVWDLNWTTCLLTFNGLMEAAEPKKKQLWPFVVMYFNWREQAIVCVTNDYKSFMVVECIKPTVTDRELSGPHDDNASLRSPDKLDKLEFLGQQRVTQDKKGKRILHNEKCPDLPLHDTHMEFLRANIKQSHAQ
uniref:Uncharacterized protein n=1 Tax=Schizaphis graminum TaxID=13262 RepID=A0A2S2NSD5_SCHGA